MSTSKAFLATATATLLFGSARRAATVAEKQKQYLDIMVSETQRLNRLINNVLDFTTMGQKKKRYEMESVDIVQLCREFIENQRVRLEYKAFSVQFKAEVEHFICYADEEAINQVLLNLLSNAEKYSTKDKVRAGQRVEKKQQ